MTEYLCIQEICLALVVFTWSLVMLSEKAMVVVFSDVGDIYFLCFLVQEEGIMLLKVNFFYST